MQELIITITQSRFFDILVKIVLISILAGIIGYEREAWRKPAGFRTYILVGISAVLVVASGEYLHEKYNGDAARIPAQLLSGIGFLGAGTILRDGNNIKGLTTAAGLLSVAAIGLVVGTGQYATAILGSIVVLCVLSYSHLLSDKLEHITNHQIKVKANNVKDYVDKIKEIVTGESLDIIKIKYGKDNNENKELVLELRAKGDINLNEIYSKISKIDGIEEIEELKNTAVPSN